MIRRLLNDVHKSTRHKGFNIIDNIILHNGKPDVKQRPCTCIVLSKALIKYIDNMLFRDFNEPMLHLVFEELAAVSSYVIENIYRCAGAVILEVGRVVTWGNKFYGVDRSRVAAELMSGVKEVVATSYAFAALKEGGSVVTWGDEDFGGDSSMVAGKLASGVVMVVATGGAFTALTEGRHVVSWGDVDGGGVSSMVEGTLVNRVVATSGAFAAITDSGRVMTWGYAMDGADSSKVAMDIESDVVKVVATGSAFAALKKGG